MGFFSFFLGGGEGDEIVVLHLFFPILRSLKKLLHCCEIGNHEKYCDTFKRDEST